MYTVHIIIIIFTCGCYYSVSAPDMIVQSWILINMAYMRWDMPSLVAFTQEFTQYVWLPWHGWTYQNCYCHVEYSCLILYHVWNSKACYINGMLMLFTSLDTCTLCLSRSNNTINALDFYEVLARVFLFKTNILTITCT